MSPSGEQLSLAIRAGRASDEDALAKLECSRGAWYENEAEEYARQKILPLSLEDSSNVRCLVAYDEERLLGCSGYRPEALMRGDGNLMLAIRLQLVAIGIEDQGRRDRKGERVSNLLMKATLDDILSGGMSRVITAIVAKENLRSIRLCERNGLRSQVEYDPAHIRLTGNFTRAK